MNPEREERRGLTRRSGDRRAPAGAPRDPAKERLRHLYEISTILTTFDNVERTVPMVLAVVNGVLPLTRGILVLEGETRPSMLVWTPDGRPGEGQTRAESDARASFSYLALGVGAHLVTRRSLVALPLVVDHHRAFGILQLEGAVLDALDLGFVNSMVNQLAVAIRRKKAEADREALFEKEQRARQEAEEANRAKDEFLAIVSHELRTPLNAIMGYAALLEAGRLDAKETAHALVVIQRNAEVQKQLISDILDVQSIVAGNLRVEIGVVDAVKVVESARETLKPAADAKAIDVQLSFESRAMVVAGDADRLRQVVWNLLSNAIKFTPSDGRIEIALRHVDDERVEITVSDTGSGISATFLPHVFERFRQADGSTTRRHGGLGLGLAIVREIVALHHGTVTAANRSSGTGAVFTVTLPRPAEVGLAPDEGIGGKSRGAAPSLGGIRVLVVDDIPDDRELLTRMLEVRGANVVSAASVAEGLAVLERERPDVLLSDIAMPEEDGYSLLRRLRALPADRGGRTPAVAVTAFADTEHADQGRDVRFQARLPKPIDAAEVAVVVAALARRAPRAH
jgi:signal transduction histidine kinase/ActR/RegA family two-component response regulator